MWTLINLTINAQNYPLKGKNTTGYNRKIKLIHRSTLETKSRDSKHKSLILMGYNFLGLTEKKLAYFNIYSVDIKRYIYIYIIVISVCLSVYFSDHNSGKLYFNYPELKLLFYFPLIYSSLSLYFQPEINQCVSFEYEKVNGIFKS